MFYINHMSKEKKDIVLALVINIFAFLMGMLFFVPTPKTDDYDIANILYGGMTGEYSGITLYINPVLGFFIKGLLQVFPMVSWYYVLQYILMIFAFSLLTYILLKKCSRRQALFYWAVLMIFSVYEFYVRITFSKTSGVLLVAGLTVILFAIDCKKKWMTYVVGISLTCIGILYRNTMLLLVLCIFFSAFIFQIFLNKKKDIRDLKKNIIKFVVIVAGLYLFSIGSDYFKAYIYENNEEWNGYREYNTARTLLIDYGWPDYETYAEEYQKLGVSENDYRMWKEISNIADPERFDKDMIENIRSIDKEDKEKLTDVLGDSTRKLIQYYVGNPMFWCFLIVICLFLLSERKNKITILSVIIGLCLFAYYYMSVRGRLQHHVDVIVCFAGIILLLYYCGKVGDKTKYILKYQIGIVAMLVIGAINYFYDDISSPSYYGKGADFSNERVEKNYEGLKLLSEDEEHFYLLDALEIYGICQGFKTFSVIERGIYHNIFLLNQYTIPACQKILGNYEIENPFAELVNSEKLYLCASENSSYRMDVILKYIQENYNEEAYYTPVKKINEVYVYRFNEGGLEVDVSEVQNSNKVEYEVNCSIKGNNTAEIEGYAFVEGEDSYTQNMYIEVQDSESGERRYYYTLQEENPKYENEDKYNGKYSSFSASLGLEEVDGAGVYLIVENSKGVYRLPIEVE